MTHKFTVNNILTMYDHVLSGTNLSTIESFCLAFESLDLAQKQEIYHNKNSLDNTLLMDAIEYFNPHFALKLIDLGFDVNVSNSKGVNPLINAIKYHQEDLAIALIDLTKDLNFARSSHGKKNGDTALIYAVNNGMVNVVKKLLEKGADPFYKNEFQQHALFYCLKQGDNDLQCFDFLLGVYQEKAFVSSITGLTIPEIIFRHGQLEHLDIIASHGLDFPNLNQQQIDYLKQTTVSSYGFKNDKNSFETYSSLVHYWDKLKNTITMSNRLVPKNPSQQKKMKI